MPVGTTGTTFCLDSRYTSKGYQLIDHFATIIDRRIDEICHEGHGVRYAMAILMDEFDALSNIEGDPIEIRHIWRETVFDCGLSRLVGL